MNRVSEADVAAYVLGQLGPTPPTMLHTLTFYVYAWYFARHRRALYHDLIEAWQYGPAGYVAWAMHGEVRTVRARHYKGYAAPGRVRGEAAETADEVLALYAPLEPVRLRCCVTREAPWKVARHGLPLHERGASRIHPAAVYRYYSAVLQAGGSSALSAFALDAATLVPDALLAAFVPAGPAPPPSLRALRDHWTADDDDEASTAEVWEAEPEQNPAALSVERMGAVALYIDMGGRRTTAAWLPGSERVRILTGPLGGKTFVSPEAATLALAFVVAPREPIPSAPLAWRTREDDEPLASARWRYADRQRQA